MLTKQEFKELVLQDTFDDIFLYHDGPYRVGNITIQFMDDHMECIGMDITCFTYERANLLPAMLYIDQ